VSVSTSTTEAGPTWAEGSQLERILLAARDLFTEQKATSFGVRDVAARAGVSLRTVYDSFGSKADLLLALYTISLHDRARSLAELVELGGSPSDRLRRYISALVEGAAADNALAIASMRENRWLSDTRPEGVRAAWEPLVRLMESIVLSADPSRYRSIGDSRRVADLLFHLVSTHVHAMSTGTIDGTPGEIAHALWAAGCAVLGLDDEP